MRAVATCWKTFRSLFLGRGARDAGPVVSILEKSSDPKIGWGEKAAATCAGRSEEIWVDTGAYVGTGLLGGW